MRGLVRGAVVVLALVGAGGVGGVVYARLRDRADQTASVPTYTVAKTSFVRRVTAEGALRAVEATPLSAPHGSEGGGALKVAWIAPDGSLVKAGDVVVRFDPTERTKALRDGQRDLDSESSRLREENIKSAALVEDRDNDAEVAASELEQQRHFQAKDEQIFSRNAIIEAQVDGELANAKLEHAQQAKAIERRLSASKAQLIAVEQQKATIAITHASKDLESMEVHAPHDGIFVLQRARNGDMTKIGDQLWPGQRLAELPLLSAMEAELFVLEVDGSGLANDQPAEIVVEARPDLVFKGKIRLVDKLAKPRVPGVPVQYFAVVIKLDTTDGSVMKPGQRVRGTLILDQQDALVVPREALVNLDGKNFVWRRGAHGFERVPVELGAATSGRVVVKSGLAAGEVIALRDPTRALDAAGPGSGSSGAGSAK